MTELAPARLILRRAEPADLPALQAILHDTFQSTWRPQITPAAAQAYLREDRPSDQELFGEFYNTETM